MDNKLTIFYDGACHLCHREIMHYQKKDKNQLLTLIDISQTSFDPADHGLDKDVHINMTTKDQQGKIYKGVESFIEIWKRIPPYNKLIPIFENKWLRPTIDFSYQIFAKKIRPRLPKRQCQDGTCSLDHI